MDPPPFLKELLGEMEKERLLPLATFSLGTSYAGWFPLWNSQDMQPQQHFQLYPGCRGLWGPLGPLEALWVQ